GVVGWAVTHRTESGQPAPDRRVEKPNKPEEPRPEAHDTPESKTRPVPKVDAPRPKADEPKRTETPPPRPQTDEPKRTETPPPPRSGEPKRTETPPTAPEVVTPRPVPPSIPEVPPTMTAKEFEDFHRLIKPQDGECQFASISW